MIKFQCVVQEGCIPQSVRGDLEKVMSRISLGILGSDQGPVDVSWSEIPKGFGFRGGEPSTSSLVRGQIPDGCDSETRRKLLIDLSRSWYDITGTTEEELVISARDMSWQG